MPPKRQNKLRVAKTGRVEVVEVESQENDKEKVTEAAVKPKKKQTKPNKAKKKVVEVVVSDSEEADDEIDFKDCESKLLYYMNENILIVDTFS